MLGRQSEVDLHRAVLQLLRHPALDVLVELASIDATLLAFLLADDLLRASVSVCCLAELEAFCPLLLPCEGFGGRIDVEAYPGRFESVWTDPASI